MSSSSIRNKTIRPGSLNGYSYYYSNRNPRGAAKQSKPKKSSTTSKSRPYRGLVWVAIIVVGAGFWLGFRSNDSGKTSETQKPASASVQEPISSNNNAVAATPVESAKVCEDNDLNKLIKVSVSQRRLWACEGNKEVYGVAVITGLRNHPETETPVGTYKIYGKVTNTTLTGSDSRGAWNDPVYYWMPFLDNKYGTYGFHDATWRPNSDFGKVSPDSADASHGCVELPLASSKWLYKWAEVGTTVNVES